MHDARERLRLQVSTAVTPLQLDAGGVETRSVSDVEVQLYVGRRLMIDEGENPCDDVSASSGLRPMRIDYLYLGVSGEISFTRSEGGEEIALSLTDVVFEADNSGLSPEFGGRPDWEDQPDIEVAWAELPWGPVW